jgi:hypothetical protein
MPADQRSWLDDDQSMALVQPAGKRARGDAGRMGSPFGFGLAFLVEGELFAQKEVLRREGVVWAQAEQQEARGIVQEHQQRGSELLQIAEQPSGLCHGQRHLSTPFWLATTTSLLMTDGAN